MMEMKAKNMAMNTMEDLAAAKAAQASSNQPITAAPPAMAAPQLPPYLWHPQPYHQHPPPVYAYNPFGLIAIDEE